MPPRPAGEALRVAGRSAARVAGRSADRVGRSRGRTGVRLSMW